MRARHLSLASSAILATLPMLLGACDGGGDGPLIDIAIVTPAGDAPLEGFDTIAVTVRQGADGEVLVSEGAVTADGFDLRVTITDFGGPVDLSAVLTGPGSRVVGGAPTFFPGETGRAGDPNGLVVVAVGPGSTCGILSELSLEDRRSSIGFSQQGTFAAALGGIDAAGPSDTASFLDLLRLGFDVDPESTGRLPALPAPLGPARAYGYSSSRALVLSELEDPFVYDITGRCDIDDPPPEGCFTHPVPAGLHTGASGASSALELSNGTVVVVGGDGGGARSGDVSWIATDGQTIRTRLTTPRILPRLVEVDTGAVLVVGGELGGAYAEVVRRNEGEGDPIDDPRVDGIVRVGGALYADPSGQSVILVGGETPTEALIAETELFTGCPSACRIGPGPDWSGVRYAPTHVQRRAGGGIIVGGGEPPVATIDAVAWTDPATPLFEPHGDLAVGRRDASALVLSNGVVFIAGGIDGSGPRLDVEMCFPESVELP